MSRAKDQWKRWHPIARSIAERLIARAEPDLTDEEFAEVQTELEKLYEKKELQNAVRDVLYLAAALEHEGQTAIALRLFQMVEAKPVIGALDRISHSRAVDRMEIMGQSAKRFAAFARSSEARRSAPDRANSSGSGRRGLTARDLRALPILV